MPLIFRLCNTHNLTQGLDICRNDMYIMEKLCEQYIKERVDNYSVSEKVHVTSGFLKLHMTAAITRSGSSCVARESGTVPARIRKPFKYRMARSTWISSLAIWRVLVTSLTLSLLALPYLHFLVNAGMAKVAPLSSRRSRMVYPRSAITSSPASMTSRKPDSRTMYLSDTFPPNGAERYVKAPSGLIPTSTLAVLLDL